MLLLVLLLPLLLCLLLILLLVLLLFPLPPLLALLVLLRNTRPIKTTWPTSAPNLGTRSCMFRAIPGGSCKVSATWSFGNDQHTFVLWIGATERNKDHEKALAVHAEVLGTSEATNTQLQPFGGEFSVLYHMGGVLVCVRYIDHEKALQKHLVRTRLVILSACLVNISCCFGWAEE